MDRALGSSPVLGQSYRSRAVLMMLSLAQGLHMALLSAVAALLLEQWEQVEWPEVWASASDQD